MERCLKSIVGLAQEIFVVDSYSTDKTLDIAGKYKANISQRPFKNQADQFNWALDNLDVKSDWILRLDADEYLTPELKLEISQVISGHQQESLPAVASQRRREHKSATAEVSGYYIKRRVYFLGRWMRHGGYYPAWFLRLWRKGAGRIEEREMDEHALLLRGKAAKLGNDFVDDNQNGLTAWMAKHNDYALREASEVIKGSRGQGGKRSFYYELPPFFRAFAYFIYRYFFRLGFLDGKKGFVFHFLHGFWYRFLIDAKIYEKRASK